MDKLDPIERLVGKPVEDMTGGELAVYMKLYLENMYGIHVVYDQVIDRKIMESLQKRYGRDIAGRIVQHVMLRRGGKKGDGYVTSSCFSTGMKWWTDDVYQELQAREQRERQQAATEQSASAGWFDVNKLLGGA